MLDDPLGDTAKNDLPSLTILSTGGFGFLCSPPSDVTLSSLQIQLKFVCYSLEMKT